MSHNGITLLELLIAISLLLLVLAAAMNIDMAGEWFFKSTSTQAEIRGELQSAIEHIVKNIQLANAIMVIPGPSGDELRVKIDENNTPSNFADDVRVIYKKSGNDVSYGTDTRDITDSTMPSLEPLTKWIVNNPSGNNIFSLSGIFLTIEMTGERVISGNTESATLISGVTLRCSSVT
jgi:hypothetical protein